MDVVISLEDIINNIKTLEEYRFSSILEEQKFYRSLIKRGTCFLVCNVDNKTVFSPSRFIGYLDNSMDKHLNNKTKDGRVTNPIIEKIVNLNFKASDTLEEEYETFCVELGFTANERGTFGVLHKYIDYRNQPSISTEDILLRELIEVNVDKLLTETERKQLVLARIGQGIFRDNLFKLWKGCSVTKYQNFSLLRASHIKPWRKCSNQERLDPYNGFLLIPNLDLVFDKGLISFAQSGNILISTKLTNIDREILGISSAMKVMLNHQNEPYLKYHRENIFIK